MPVSKAARFGLYAVTMMARAPGEAVSARAVAETFGISENHVAKVLQQLVRARLVRGTRGVGGGYQLSCDPTQVSMLEVVESIDGPRPGKCAQCDLWRGDGDDCQPHPAACAIQRVFSEIEQTAYFTMKSVTLATLASSDFVGLAHQPATGKGRAPAR